MSLSSLYSSNVRRKKEELARLKKDRVKYVSDISSASQKITRLSSQIKNTKSLSTIKPPLSPPSMVAKVIMSSSLNSVL